MNKSSSIKVSLLTGGKDRHYMLGLVSGLADAGVSVDLIGSEDMRHAELTERPNVAIHSFRDLDQRGMTLRKRLVRVCKYYLRLLTYAARTDSKIFHIQWLNSFPHFERTLLNLYFLFLGKKIIFTAHNINAAARDGRDSLLNRLTLGFMYRRVHHIIVHTEEMKEDLIREFRVRPEKITVARIGLNVAIPRTGMSREKARDMLGLNGAHKTLLFFGNISPYKGLEDLIAAAAELKATSDDYRDLKVLIAGRIKERRDLGYWAEIKELIRKHDLDDAVVDRIQFIPDDEVEAYYRGADVLVLPYRSITQSGMTVLAYRFGTPVIATDIGAFREDVVVGDTGFVYAPRNPSDLAAKLRLFFEGDLFRQLETTRRRIEEYGARRYSWRAIADRTCDVYRKVGGGKTASTGVDDIQKNTAR